MQDASVLGVYAPAPMGTESALFVHYLLRPGLSQR